MPRYSLVSEQSTVLIEARSSVHPIRVEAPATGWIELPTGLAVGPASGRIEIPVAELRSGNPLIDRETRRRVDANRHRAIIGDLNEVLEQEQSAATIQGSIEFIGETVDLHGTVEFDLGTDRLAMNGAATFDVRWWGLEPPRLLMLKVDPEVVVSIDLVFRRT